MLQNKRFDSSVMPKRGVLGRCLEGSGSGS